MNENKVRRPYTVKEFAEAARLSPNAVYEMVRRLELPAVHFGRAIRLPADQCDRLLTGRNVTSSAATASE